MRACSTGPYCLLNNTIYERPEKFFLHRVVRVLLTWVSSNLSIIWFVKMRSLSKTGTDVYKQTYIFDGPTRTTLWSAVNFDSLLPTLALASPPYASFAGLTLKSSILVTSPLVDWRYASCTLLTLVSFFLMGSWMGLPVIGSLTMSQSEQTYTWSISSFVTSMFSIL